MEFEEMNERLLNEDVFLIVRPIKDKDQFEFVEINKKFELIYFQDLIDGYVETVTLGLEPFAMIADEEARYKEKPLNNISRKLLAYLINTAGVFEKEIKEEDLVTHLGTILFCRKELLVKLFN